ncbi:hypothetical protein HHI36_013280, partial [Cryptolaemus montrouzieri]
KSVGKPDKKNVTAGIKNRELSSSKFNTRNSSTRSEPIVLVAAPTGPNSYSTLSGADKLGWIHVGRVSLEATNETVQDHLNVNFPGKSFIVEQLPERDGATCEGNKETETVRIKRKCLNVVHLNIQSVRNKIPQINIYANGTDTVGTNCDILCMTEHFLKKNEADSFVVENFNVESCFSKNTNSGGSLILSRENIKCLELVKLKNVSRVNDCEISVIQVCKEKLKIAAIYRCPTGDFEVFMDIMNELLPVLAKSGKML